jgi:hypothetical protein
MMPLKVTSPLARSRAVTRYPGSPVAYTGWLYGY